MFVCYYCSCSSRTEGRSIYNLQYSRLVYNHAQWATVSRARLGRAGLGGASLKATGLSRLGRAKLYVCVKASVLSEMICLQMVGLWAYHTGRGERTRTSKQPNSHPASGPSRAPHKSPLLPLQCMRYLLCTCHLLLSGVRRKSS